MKYKHFLENFEIVTHKFKLEPTRKSQVRIPPEADIWNFCVGFYFNIFSLPGKIFQKRNSSLSFKNSAKVGRGVNSKYKPEIFFDK